MYFQWARIIMFKKHLLVFYNYFKIDLFLHPAYVYMYINVYFYFCVSCFVQFFYNDNISTRSCVHVF